MTFSSVKGWVLGESWYTPRIPLLSECDAFHFALPDLKATQMQKVVRIVVFCFAKGADVSLYSSQFFDTFIHQYDESRFPFSGRAEISQSQMREIECRQTCSVLELGSGEVRGVRLSDGAVFKLFVANRVRGKS